MDPLNADDTRILAEKILSSRKYHSLLIPPQTVESLIRQSAPSCKSAKELEKSVREKLHQIIAPYLGDPDYRAAARNLESIAPDDRESLEEWSTEMLQSHSSTKERLPYNREFFRKIFEVTGRPQIILDLACGMNPFAFLQMDLPGSTLYHAYDIHQPRVDLINLWFKKINLEPLAEIRDILIEPPAIQADVAFFFKEAHRFESRSKGCNRNFFQAIQAKWLIVTLPSENLTKTHHMRERQYSLIEKSIENTTFTYTEFEISSEMIFCLRKNGEEENQN